MDFKTIHSKSGYSEKMLNNNNKAVKNIDQRFMYVFSFHTIAREKVREKQERFQAFVVL
jgi:hypothetical protein